VIKLSMEEEKQGAKTQEHLSTRVKVDWQ
jgi:hypothetical protein